MKYYRYLLITILIASTNAYAFQPKVEIIERFDNLKMVSFISIEAINNNPEWNPDSGAPPLLVGDAIAAVKAFVKDPGAVKEIEIRQVPRHEKKWHYLIKIADDSMKFKYSIYVVLMDGTVIPSIIEPQGYK